jgi:hypothetical protein
VRPRRFLDGGATAAINGNHFYFCQMYNTRTPTAHLSCLLMKTRDQSWPCRPSNGSHGIIISLPIPAPSVPLPTRSSPPQRVIPEQSRDAPQTATSLAFDADILELKSKQETPDIFIPTGPPSILPRVTVESLLTSTRGFSAVYPPP